MERQITLGDVIAPAKVLRCDNDDYPVLSMTMHDGIVLQSDRFKKSLASIDQSNYKVVLRGQLVVGFPIDEGVIYVQNITEAGIMSPAYGVWNIHSKEIMPEYLELCLHSPQSMDYYMNKLRGTTARRRSITTGDLLALPITLPSLTEQKRRIGLLQQATLLLNSQKQAMLKFDELVKSRFVEMFGEMHSRVYETKKLREFCKFQQGTQVPIEEQIETQLEGYTRFLRIIDYTQAPQPPRYVSVKGKKIEEDSVVVVRYGATAGFVGHGYAGILANNLFEVIPDEATMSKEFLYLTLKHGTFEQEVHDKAFGAAMPALSFGMMNDIIVAVPSKQAQNEFIVFVKQVDKSKLAVKQSLEKLETLKKSLMQQYFG